MSSNPLSFPSYDSREVAADRIVHILGGAVAGAAVAWLWARFLPGAGPVQAAALIAYGLGVAGMLGASAAYNLWPAGGVKARLRVIDHAMIFVMIAGTYTPFALQALPRRLGLPLCGAVWGLAAVGVLLKLLWFDRFQKLSLVLYLGMGWLVLTVIRSLVALLPASILILMLAGGVVYSLGSALHARGRPRFHNAAWHLMVLVALLLHLWAIALLFDRAIL